MQGGQYFMIPLILVQFFFKKATVYTALKAYGTLNDILFIPVPSKTLDLPPAL